MIVKRQEEQTLVFAVDMHYNRERKDIKSPAVKCQVPKRGEVEIF